MKVKGRRFEWAVLLALVAAAAFLRLYRLDVVPPGWRDDELINSLVISQHALDGEWAFFYPDASGHEALYHVLNAGMLALFGPGVAGIRWLSVGLGTLSVALTYALGRELYGRAAGFIAGLGLAFSFWSLMYSRIGLRHVSLLPFMLGAFLLWWKGQRRARSADSACRAGPCPRLGREIVLAGLLMGLGMYTYFAARGLPAILLAMAAYWLLFDRPAFCRRGGGAVAVVLIALLIAVPLMVSVARMPAMTGRVEELAVPLVEARNGNLEPLWHHVVVTLSMFHADGDGEWLYNIPNRPVLNPLGAALLLTGVLISLYRALPFTPGGRKSESIFVLFWLGAGLVPGFISVPPASLGHTIIAQPVAYLMPAVALASAAEAGARRWGRRATIVVALVAALFLASNAARDLGDYFNRWPERGMVRLLYRADIREAADALNQQHAGPDLAVGGTLAGSWDQQAFRIGLNVPAIDRWFDPRRALLFPGQGGNLILLTYPELAPELAPALQGEAELVSQQRGFDLYSTRPPGEPTAALAPFENGLVLVNISPTTTGVLAEWFVETPPFGDATRPLISNPPPPGVDTRPRLQVFAHLLDAEGGVVVGDDGMWVDPYTVRSGDRWIQLHRFAEPVWEHDLEIGLYDPVTGERVRTADGTDRILIRLTRP